MIRTTGKEEEGIIRPRRAETDPPMGPNVLMALIKKDLHHLVGLMAPNTPQRHILDFFFLYRPKQETPGAVSAAGPFLGAPQAVMGLEKLIALGARRVWVLGWCGSIQHDLKIGDMVLPTTCLVEEGTSQHYPLQDRLPATDSELNDGIERALQERGWSFQKGTVWTTDAPYRETPSKVRDYRERGILAVEMEMSALMRVALYRGIRLSALLVVSDELSRLEWHHGFRAPRFKEASRLAAEILLNLAGSFTP